MTRTLNDDLQSTYDRIASDFAVDHEHDAWDVEFIEKFGSLLPRAASMLDVGCGPGWELKRLHRTGLHQVGFDLSSGLLEIAKRNNPKATFVQGDMRSLPFKLEAFDGVTARASLLHIPKNEAHQVLKEIVRVLKPGGIFYIALKKIRNNQSPEELKTENDYGYDYQRFFAYWSMPELLTVLEQHGFKPFDHVETPTPSGRTIWLKVLARKK